MSQGIIHDTPFTTLGKRLPSKTPGSAVGGRTNSSRFCRYVQVPWLSKYQLSFCVVNIGPMTNIAINVLKSTPGNIRESRLAEYPQKLPMPPSSFSAERYSMYPDNTKNAFTENAPRLAPSPPKKTCNAKTGSPDPSLIA